MREIILNPKVMRVLEIFKNRLSKQWLQLYIRFPFFFVSGSLPKAIFVDIIYLFTVAKFFSCVLEAKPKFTIKNVILFTVVPKNVPKSLWQRPPNIISIIYIYIVVLVWKS